VHGARAGLRRVLFLWNRSGPDPADVTIDGDRDVLAGWQSGVRVRWN